MLRFYPSCEEASLMLEYGLAIVEVGWERQVVGLPSESNFIQLPRPLLTQCCKQRLVYVPTVTAR